MPHQKSYAKACSVFFVYVLYKLYFFTIPPFFLSLTCCIMNHFVNLESTLYTTCGLGSDWLRAGRSGDRIPVEARFSAPVQTGPGAHPASCTMGTGSFPGVKSGRVMTLTPHPLLVPRSRKSRAVPLLPLWAIWSVQSLSACTRVHFTF